MTIYKSSYKCGCPYILDNVMNDPPALVRRAMADRARYDCYMCANAKRAARNARAKERRAVK